MSTFQNLLDTYPQANYPSHSRVHRLASFDCEKVKCYIKRDDELGFGISGSKIRKYRSLVPWLVQEKYQEIVIIGSASSNHVLSLCQLLIENRIKPTLFLRGDPKYSLKGNCLFTSLFVSLSSIHWISKKEWASVETLAHHYAVQQGHKTFVLPEGGTVSPALPGALSLAIDIVKNEREGELKFDHIFIDAGTGFTACALLLGLGQLNKKSCVHILLLAENEESFHHRLEECSDWFVRQIQTSVSLPPFLLYRPELAGDFGQTAPSLFQFIKQMARVEGFLADPIYTGKLFLEGKRILSMGGITGNVLFIHSGGGLSLTGFLNRLG